MTLPHDPRLSEDLPNYSRSLKSRDVSNLTYEDGYRRGVSGESWPMTLANTPYWNGVRDGYKERREAKRREAWNAITGEIEAARPELV